jgi:hypothetical protein
MNVGAGPAPFDEVRQLGTLGGSHARPGSKKVGVAATPGAERIPQAMRAKTVPS